MLNMIFKSRILVAILLLAMAGLALADESTNVSSGLTVEGGPLALHGYDAVAYFTTGKALRGTAKFSAKHDGAVYRFASQDNLNAFTQSPAAYAPQFGGFCAYGVALGKKFDGDPEIFAIVDGKLYLNLSPDIKATWEKDLKGNIAKASDQWPAIKSKPAGSL